MPSGRTFGAKDKRKRLGRNAMESLRPIFMKVVVAALEDEKTALDTAKAFKDKVFSNLPAKIEVETKTVEEFISEETEE